MAFFHHSAADRAPFHQLREELERQRQVMQLAAVAQQQQQQPSLLGGPAAVQPPPLPQPQQQQQPDISSRVEQEIQKQVWDRMAERFVRYDDKNSRS